MTTEVKFDLVRPCKMCPFRTDCLDGWLGRARAASIAHELLIEQKSFSCHETTEAGGSDPKTPEQHCAGALLVLEEEGASPQLARWMERIGYYDPARLDRDSPTFSSFAEFITHHADAKRDPEFETCSVVEAGCEAPAGYGGYGGQAVENVLTEDVCSACESCGEPVCDTCCATHEPRVCKTCADG